MSLTLANVTLDCGDVLALSRFWSNVLHRPIDNGASELAATIGYHDPSTPTWLFMQVPEPKTAKNRMHVDFRADDNDAEVARILAMGATRVGDHDQYGVRWTVLADPEGNEFCVGQPSGG